MRDEAGQVVGVLDTVIETTAERLAQQQLRQLTNSLERQVAERTRDRNRLWNLSPDVMLITRLDMVITAANPALEPVLGWTEKELVGTSSLDLVHSEDLNRAWGASHSLMQGESLRDFECRMRHKDGSYRWINWSSSPGEGHICAIGRDITQERERAETLHQTEELLRQSQKMEAVGQLTGGLAHDFNNLLAGISGSLELLKLRINQGRTADLDRYISTARTAAERAATLTHRLLAFSRRQALDPKPTSVNRLVAGMQELISRTMGPMIEVEVLSGPELWTVLVDPNQLESALLNVCINARDAMPGGGKLCIGTCNQRLDGARADEHGLPPGEYMTLYVTDTGTGMADDVIARVFDPFFTTKPSGQAPASACRWSTASPSSPAAACRSPRGSARAPACPSTCRATTARSASNALPSRKPRPAPNARPPCWWWTTKRRCACSSAKCCATWATRCWRRWTARPD